MDINLGYSMKTGVRLGKSLDNKAIRTAKMTAGELIEYLRKFPADTKILVDVDTAWVELTLEDISYMQAFRVWHSDYNGEGIPYVSFHSEPSNKKYISRQGLEYVERTLGSEGVISFF
jgi:hypothetical protein